MQTCAESDNDQVRRAEGQHRTRLDRLDVPGLKLPPRCDR